MASRSYLKLGRAHNAVATVPLCDATEQLLRDRLAEVQRRIGKLAEAPERGADLAFGKRIGDGTTEAVSRLTDVGVGGNLEVTEAKLLRALAKVSDGTYGFCDVCGQPINPKRLAAMPESTACIDHAR
ncbi:MAG: DnaK suppressor protein [Solirubrobacteraceae bacterium]|nr:DnaK suppressor protein [Solirubrobacteraceae bacterium]